MKLFWRNTRINPPLIKGEEAGKHMECLDIMDIKQNNIKSIMNVLRENNGQSGMTKKEIADKTGLSFATVSKMHCGIGKAGCSFSGKDTVFSQFRV